ncbi:hypothetical protein CPB85DRAFT_1319750 [Mucidula mucida]|nr:hypothetical protein CPB85DRAFT_1319750 [Mucidula mucida]
MAAEDGFVHIPWRSNKLTISLKVSSAFQYNLQLQSLSRMHRRISKIVFTALTHCRMP